MTQETFYRAFRSVERFDGKSKVSTWLCGIAKNVWRSYSSKHLTSVEFQEVESSENVEETVINQLTQKEILKRIHMLKDEEREIMLLRLFGNLSFKEIGEVMGQTENNVRVKYYRCKVKIRKELE